MFLYTWLWGDVPSTPQALPKPTEEIVEEFHLVESLFQKVTKKDVQELYQKLPQNIDHQLSIRASICCPEDAKSLLKVFNESILLAGNKEQKILKDEGPYKLAISSDVKEGPNSVLRTYHFINGMILGARGVMAHKERITFRDGSRRHCTSQALVDLTRWGAHSKFYINHQKMPIAAPPGAPKVGLTGGLEYPLLLVELLEKIEKVLGSPTRFSEFSFFFNQGPFNDMFYAMTADVQQRWDAILFPNKEMKRSFDLITGNDKNGNDTIKKVVIVLTGHFVAGAFGEAGVVEPKKDQKLGTFTGITKINLNTGAATVITHVKVFPEVWEKLLNNKVEESPPTPLPLRQQFSAFVSGWLNAK